MALMGLTEKVGGSFGSSYESGGLRNFDPSWLIRLVRGFAAVADGVGDGLLVCGDGGREGLGGAVDGDGC